MPQPAEGVPQLIKPDNTLDVDLALREFGLGADELGAEVEGYGYKGTVVQMLMTCGFVRDALRDANLPNGQGVDSALEGLHKFAPKFTLRRSEATIQRAEALRREAGKKNTGRAFFFE